MSSPLAWKLYDQRKPQETKQRQSPAIDTIRSSKTRSILDQTASKTKPDEKVEKLLLQQAPNLQNRTSNCLIANQNPCRNLKTQSWSSPAIREPQDLKELINLQAMAATELIRYKVKMRADWCRRKLQKWWRALRQHTGTQTAWHSNDAAASEGARWWRCRRSKPFRNHSECQSLSLSLRSI